MRPDKKQFDYPEDINRTTTEMMDEIRAQEHEYSDLIKEQDHIKHGGVKEPISSEYLPNAKAPF